MITVVHFFACEFTITMVVMILIQGERDSIGGEGEERERDAVADLRGS